MAFVFLRFPGIFPHNYDHINEDIVFLEIDFDSLIVFCSISKLSSITEKKITKSLDIFEDSWRGFKFYKSFFKSIMRSDLNPAITGIVWRFLTCDSISI